MEFIPKKDKKLPPAKKKPLPTYKTSFASWIQQFQEPEEQNKARKKKERKKNKQKPKKKDPVIIKKKKTVKKNKKGVVYAEQSLKENKDIVSETLASLLASQGSYEKAIEMFEKLSLIFPEKSGYFADQIKKLIK